jgi:hypothetical protein
MSRASAPIAASFALAACHVGDSPPRTVSGTFLIDYQPGSGTRTRVPAAPWVDAISSLDRDPGYRLDGLLVPDSSATGYTLHPAALGPDYSFSVPDVPVGRYFLVLSRDCVRSGVPTNPGPTVKCVDLTELSASAPDLSTAAACRRDIARPTNTTSVTVSLGGFEPWTRGSSLAFSSSQACLSDGPAVLTPVPLPGATIVAGSFRWGEVLPSAAKGDVVFLYQRSRGTLGGGAAEFFAATRFLRLTGFSLDDGAVASLTGIMGAPSMRSGLSLDLRWSQFASLASEVHPTAIPQPFPAVAIMAVARPGRMRTTAALIAGAVMTGPAIADVGYGTLSYGVFLDPSWRELRKVEYAFQVNIADPGSPNPIARTVQMGWRTWSSAVDPGPVVPSLGPPRSPLVNGAAAFEPRAGVGTQPVLSWSPPAIGRPTSYVVTIEEVVPTPGAAQLTVRIRSGTSFRVPAGYLRAGSRYVATIAAIVAGGDGGDRLQPDADESDASCITGVFTP